MISALPNYGCLVIEGIFRSAYNVWMSFLILKITLYGHSVIYFRFYYVLV